MKLIPSNVMRIEVLPDSLDKWKIEPWIIRLRKGILLLYVGPIMRLMQFRLKVVRCPQHATRRFWMTALELHPRPRWTKQRQHYCSAFFNLAYNLNQGACGMNYNDKQWEESADVEHTIKEKTRVRMSCLWFRDIRGLFTHCTTVWRVFLPGRFVSLLPFLIRLTNLCISTWCERPGGTGALENRAEEECGG